MTKKMSLQRNTGISVPSAEDYRRPMPVRKVLVIKQDDNITGYYICPRCNISMEREFMSYCDRCGQALDWHGYRSAIPVYPKGAGE